MNPVEANLKHIKQLIADYEKKYNRPPGSVHLVAVSKGQPVDDIVEALATGQTAFGENHLQEALPKIEMLKDKKIEWHFIGSIQSNKTRKIAAHFAWVEGVANEKIAQRLNDQRPEHLPPLNICIEVNISHEASKSGVSNDEVESLANFCLTLPRLKLRGLMCIPAEEADLEKQRCTFRKLTSLYQQLNQKGFKLDCLSMGMSHDFEAAIAEGATSVRIGRAIFGPRHSP